MNQYITLFLLFIFFIITLNFHPYFHLYYLKIHAILILKRMNRTLESLKISHECVVYYIPLPSRNPYVKHATFEQLYPKKIFHNPFSPKLQGLSFLLQITGEAPHEVAYINPEEFFVPELYQIWQKQQISKKEYELIRQCKLLDPNTISQLNEEVYRKLTS